MVVTSATVIVLAGSTAISQNTDEASYVSAVDSVQSAGATINELSTRGGGTSIDLSNIEGGTTSISESAGKIEISVINGTHTSEYETELGTLYHERDGHTVAYQNGGVFELADNGSSVVSTPPINYRVRNGQPSLTIPIIAFKGTSADGRMTAERKDVTDIVASGALDLDPGSAVNPAGIPEGNDLSITIESDYYKAWGQVFEDQLNVSADYDHAAEMVAFSLEGSYDPDDGRTVCVANCGPDDDDDDEETATTISDSAVLATDGIGSITNTVSTDSYDSIDGPYSSSRNSEGDVRINGHLYFQNELTIRGDLHLTEGLEGTSASDSVVEGETRLGNYPDGTPGWNAGSGSEMTFRGDFSMDDHFSNDNMDLDFESNVYIGDGVEHFTNVDVGRDMHVHGEFDASGTTGQDSVIEGDLIVDGDVTLNGHITVEGDILASGTVDPNGAVINGNGDLTTDPSGYASGENVNNVIEETREPDVPTRPSRDSLIENMGETFSDENDNDGTFSSDWTSVSGETTVTSGNYTTDGLQVNGGTLILDATGGDPINIYTESVQLNNGGQIVVRGDTSDVSDQVNFYIDGQLNINGDDSGIVTGSRDNPTQEAPLVWAYVHTDGQVILSGSGNFTGVLYGSGGPDGSGTPISTGTNDIDVFGTMIGNIGSFSENAAIHYDEALGDRTIDGGDSGDDDSGDGGEEEEVYDDLGPGSGEQSQVAFLHSSYRPVELE